jgi:hypothetical protein
VIPPASGLARWWGQPAAAVYSALNVMKRLRRRPRLEMGPLFRVDFENDHRPRIQDNRQAPVRVIHFVAKRATVENGTLSPT